MSRIPRDVICFGNDWYSSSKVSVRQIVEHFHAAGSRLVWVNPVPIRFPDTKQKDFWNKVQSKARTHARFLSKQGDRLYVYSPIYLPLYKGPGFWLNRLAVSLQVALVRLVLGIRNPLIVGSTWTAWFARWSYAGSPLVFHFADKISSFREVSKFPERRRLLEKMEAELIERATLNTCSSRSIHDHVLQVAGDDQPKVKYLPHAVAASVFRLDDDGQATPVPLELADIDGPVAGYFGSLTETNDKETFLHAARTLPDWTFVFIGKTLGDYSELDALPNVRFLGARPHATLPTFGARFDVGFMGWKPHEWITNCFPLKTLEYLALGKPIVCSGHIAELAERFPEFVRITTGPEEFTRALVEERERDDDEKRSRRREVVRRETWDHRLQEILETLERLDAKYGVR